MRFFLSCFLLLTLAACSDESSPRILAGPPPRPADPSVPTASSEPEPAVRPLIPHDPSPIEEHDDQLLERYFVSRNEILAALMNDGALYVAHTTDGGDTWKRTKLDLGDPHVWYAHFSKDGTRLDVEMYHGSSSTYDFAFVTRDRAATWTRLPGGGFRMKPPPK